MSGPEKRRIEDGRLINDFSLFGRFVNRFIPGASRQVNPQGSPDGKRVHKGIFFHSADAPRYAQTPNRPSGENIDSGASDATTVDIYEAEGGRAAIIPPLETLTSEERRALARPLLQTSAEALASQFCAEYDQLN